MRAERVTNLYDLADAAYDAKGIREMSARLEHVATINHTRAGARSASLLRPMPFGTASGTRPSASIHICTTTTAGAISVSEAMPR